MWNWLSQLLRGSASFGVRGFGSSDRYWLPGCDIFSSFACRLREVAGNRPERAEVGMERVAGMRLNRADERTAEQDFPGLHDGVMGGEFVGQPGNGVGGMA